jgi:hypothetical protein
MTEPFAPGPLDRPAPRWRVALTRLPVTLAVLLVVAGGAAGLAYVASGSGEHRFPATLLNDLGERVQVGACEQDDCKSGGLLNAYLLSPGKRLTVALRPGSTVNPILITTQESKRVGCLFPRYRHAPKTPPLIRLSEARTC